jgi:hypothetical protein
LCFHFDCLEQRFGISIRVPSSCCHEIIGYRPTIDAQELSYFDVLSPKTSPSTMFIGFALNDTYESYSTFQFGSVKVHRQFEVQPDSTLTMEQLNEPVQKLGTINVAFSTVEPIEIPKSVRQYTCRTKSGNQVKQTIVESSTQFKPTAQTTIPTVSDVYGQKFWQVMNFNTHIYMLMIYICTIYFCLF